MMLNPMETLNFCHCDGRALCCIAGEITLEPRLRHPRDCNECLSRTLVARTPPCVGIWDQKEKKGRRSASRPNADLSFQHHYNLQIPRFARNDIEQALNYIEQAGITSSEPGTADPSLRSG